MTDRDALLALADRVEGLAGPDREVDAAIFRAIGAPVPFQFASKMIALNYDEDRQAYFADVPGGLRVRYSPPAYTASIDAAMTLVPEGRDWMIDNFDGPHDRRCSASVFNAKGQDYADYEAFAATPAPALCAASLRALAGERG